MFFLFVLCFICDKKRKHKQKLKEKMEEVSGVVISDANEDETISETLHPGEEDPSCSSDSVSEEHQQPAATVEHDVAAAADDDDDDATLAADQEEYTAIPDQKNPVTDVLSSFEVLYFSEKARESEGGDSKWAKEENDGVYHCVRCENVLYNSKDKFIPLDSTPSQWATFRQPATENSIQVRRNYSFGLKRTEILCLKVSSPFSFHLFFHRL